MKICNNCSATNELAVIKCIACNMHGDFTPITASVDEMPVGEVQSIQCTNCGSFHPGEGVHCSHCRFPLDRGSLKLIPKRTIQLFRKVI